MEKEQKNIIELKNVYVNYGNFQALKNINLEIKKNENWVFLGANGSGKSTLLKLFSNDLYPNTSYEFKKLLALLGLPPRGLHATRHSFCSHLLYGGVPAPLVAHTLGHSNLDMVNRVYSHFLENRSDLRNLNRAMKL